MADRVRDDLAGQVDLDRRVDRDHPAERADDVGVVGEVDRPHLDHRVVVDEVVQPRRTHQERRDDLAAVALLGGPGDDAGLDEVDDGVREHLGVDRRGRACPSRAMAVAAGIAPIPSWSVAPSGTSSATCSPIRRSTSPIDRVACSYGGTSTSTARSMSSTWMKLSPSVRGIDRLSWTMTVFAARMAACIASTLVPSEQKPWASGGVALTRTTSSGSAPALEEVRDVGQEDRHVVGAALVDRRAGIRPDEQRAMPEVAGHLGRQVWPRPLRVEVDDADVAQLLGAIDERLEHDRRSRGRAMQVDALTGPDDAGRVGRRDEPHRHSLRADRVAGVDRVGRVASSIRASRPRSATAW